MAFAQLNEEIGRAKSIYEKLTAELETSSQSERATDEQYRAGLAGLLSVK